ncbi:hypothetical protein DIPPA_17085 [Diplonema papillatum]|nr:hypothetical protein DIPPA_17085 [Diplonema papillatum]
MANVVYELERLAALRTRGLLTDEEFAWSKATVIRDSGACSMPLPAAGVSRASVPLATSSRKSASSSETQPGTNVGKGRELAQSPPREALPARQRQQQGKEPAARLEETDELVAESLVMTAVHQATRIQGDIMAAVASGEHSGLRDLLMQQSQLSERRAVTPPI